MRENKVVPSALKSAIPLGRGQKGGFAPGENREKELGKRLLCLYEGAVEGETRGKELLVQDVRRGQEDGALLPSLNAPN
ncbi:hypothetical protein HWI79_3479 [Cryptosporidium felis]|nr:hypothetical protein HWI79_3479 [Cryptosporidium felis]